MVIAYTLRCIHTLHAFLIRRRGVVALRRPQNNFRMAGENFCYKRLLALALVPDSALPVLSRRSLLPADVCVLLLARAVTP